jgi:hypothetical protein
MRQVLGTGLIVCCGVMAAVSLLAQQNPAQQDAPVQQSVQQPAQQSAPTPAQTAPQTAQDTGPVPLEWTPPALVALSAQAELKDSFTLDRNLLHAAADFLPDSEESTRHSIEKLEGVSVHLLRFGPNGVPDETAVNAVREAYHLRGWKHYITTTEAGGPVRDRTTDVWMVVDGVNVRGAVILAETQRSVTLVTVAGNLSPVDILHLRGHFGIPKFEGDILGETHEK